jgi:Skp family chaperone for outer membrane proteins
MTGIETLIALMKIIVPMGAIIFSAILKFLWDIKSNSKEVQKEFQTFKLDFTSEITSLKNKIDILDSKTKDSYSKSETDNLFLKLKNEFLEKIVLKRKHREEDEN